jgi:hypothetical protein
MDVTESGMESEVNPVAPLKASCPISTTECGNITEVKLVQPATTPNIMARTAVRTWIEGEGGGEERGTFSNNHTEKNQQQ